MPLSTYAVLIPSMVLIILAAAVSLWRYTVSTRRLSRATLLGVDWGRGDDLDAFLLRDRQTGEVTYHDGERVYPLPYAIPTHRVSERELKLDALRARGRSMGLML